jgi:hypothetical protein
VEGTINAEQRVRVGRVESEVPGLTARVLPTFTGHFLALQAPSLWGHASLDLLKLVPASNDSDIEGSRCAGQVWNAGRSAFNVRLANAITTSAASVTKATNAHASFGFGKCDLIDQWSQH